MDMHRACLQDYSGSKEDYVHLMEFYYNNSYQANQEDIDDNFIWKEISITSLLG